MNNDYDHDYNYDVMILTEIENDIALTTVYKLTLWEYAYPD